ncbi:RT0821/Lpp0805 family surface protein [Nitrobacter vulgaris]|uniref:RT0821/Lpp0805 family surface protein n=1 Tax=Nitrobacter vulgaris TaxID=29421 RepID=UPI001FCDED8B|nr:RT0821/Lpp0805 family surface protein [Nitrobacter vulgaris]
MRSLYRANLYRARLRVGLSAIGPFAAIVAAIMIGATTGGCSMARNQAAFAQMGDDEATGSIAALSHARPTDTDLAFARTAASDVLTKGNKDASQPWENPSTGARGSVTPLAQAYSAEGRTCRDFLASYVNGKSESWLQGAACRARGGQWEIQSLKPWRS